MTEALKDEKQNQAISNASKRKQHKAAKAESGEKKTWWVQIRLFPIWLRIILVAVLLAGAVAGGLMFGYGFLGDGEAKNALKWDTWQHIIDILKGKE